MTASVPPGLCEELIRHYKDQVIYYEDLKPWKLYLRKILWEHVQKQSEMASISELAKEFIENKDNKKLLSYYFTKTSQAASAAEIDKEIENYHTYHDVIEDYDGVTHANEPPIADVLWVPTEDLKVEYACLYTNDVSPMDFVNYWYTEVDKELKVPLFHLYRKRYYDWVGNSLLRKTEVSSSRAPRYMWKPMLKQMVKNGVVDPVYFKQHPTLKLYPVDKVTFDAQRFTYETKYTRDYMEAKTLEISRRMSLDEDERLAEKLDNISETTNPKRKSTKTKMI